MKNKKEEEKERIKKCFTKEVSLLFFLLNTQTSVNSTFFSAVI